MTRRKSLLFALLAAVIVLALGGALAGRYFSSRLTDNPKATVHHEQRKQRKLPPYDAHFSDDIPTYLIDGDIAGYNVFASAGTTDPQELAQITEAINGDTQR